MMRSISFLSLLLCCTTYLHAQSVGFGPEVGLGMSSMRFVPSEGFTNASGSTIFSGKIGGLVDVRLSKSLYLQSGLYLSRKGQSREFSFKESDSLNEYVQQTLTINYIDVPVNIIYKTCMQGKGRVMLGIGVTPSYILGGKNKLNAHGSDSGVAYTTNINAAIANGKPVGMFDIGINLLAGYELPTGLFFRAYYTAGMNDIGLGTETDKNRMWGISSGYIFGKGRNINKDADDLIDKTTD